MYQNQPSYEQQFFSFMKLEPAYHFRIPKSKNDFAIIYIDVMEKIKWCKDNLGKQNVSWGYYKGKRTFYFLSEEDFVLFKLRFIKVNEQE